MTDKMKCSFFQAVVESILLYGCTTWTLTKLMEQLHKNAVSNAEQIQHPTKQQLYGHLPPIKKTVQVDKPDMWDTAGKDELISDILQWTPSYDQAKAG